MKLIESKNITDELLPKKKKKSVFEKFTANNQSTGNNDINHNDPPSPSHVRERLSSLASMFVGN